MLEVVIQKKRDKEVIIQIWKRLDWPCRQLDAQSWSYLWRRGGTNQWQENLIVPCMRWLLLPDLEHFHVRTGMGSPLMTFVFSLSGLIFHPALYVSRWHPLAFLNLERSCLYVRTQCNYTTWEKGKKMLSLEAFLIFIWNFFSPA